MHELPWITIVWLRVRWFDNDFTSDEVKGENHWHITSRVTKKIDIYCNECIVSFLTHYFVLNTPFRYKQTLFSHFDIVA